MPDSSRNCNKLRIRSPYAVRTQPVVTDFRARTALSILALGWLELPLGPPHLREGVTQTEFLNPKIECGRLEIEDFRGATSAGDAPVRML